MYDRYKARQAALAALPPGYQFSGCNEVRARGLDPLHSYEPGYSERMDGDGDGIACEPYRR
ncbi:excalibur calcium-binding domain-containing protein [Sphingobium sp. CR28]|uniref:excalibur calcium-binding domain-containing protein n=1 Tax=Sphingobium sp. CR28 TaxID=3400272 RepID=UPI003FED471C